MFAGSVADNRAKFLAWGERAKDRVALYDTDLIQAMQKVENRATAVSADDSRGMGITEAASKELQAFLKNHTEGTANSIVRSNRT